MSKGFKITIIILGAILISVSLSFVEYPCKSEPHGYGMTTCRMIDKLSYSVCDMITNLTTDKPEQLTPQSEYVVELNKCLLSKYWFFIF